ncbi:MAG: ribonuclease J [Desulfovibrio sp.]|jgi:ribonuclease J|nr:ribonuclease J [Desulfovibrio sp.]
MDSPKLTITPLGGFGEIGLNCQLWESPQNTVMIDCGLMFPDDEHLGVDVVIPSFEVVARLKDKISGVLLTHGHEDHIGAIPWLVRELNKGTHIYGSRLTLALVENKLRERGILNWTRLCPVSADTVLTLGDMKFHFFPVCHSIPEGFGIGAETPVGRIVHSGDFKIDPHPLSGSGTNLQLFKKFAGADGVRLLLSDSTNVMRPGRSLPEGEVKKSLDKLFGEAAGRIIVTLFSSHIQRIQEVFDLAEEHGRTVVISGKSLAGIIETACALKLLHPPREFFNAYNSVPDLPDKELVLLVTGAQGEQLSALSRMVLGGHRQLNIRQGDTVIMSSRMIPGNTRAILRLINEMYRLGAEVLYDDISIVHASGHAYADELRDMLLAVRPQLFVPIHGEYQHLVKHARLARTCGVLPENAIVLEDGAPLTLTDSDFRLEQCVTPEYTLVDGKGVGDVGLVVLRERRILGDEGMVIVVLVLDSATGSVLHGPEMTSRGFVFEQQYSYILEDAKCLVLDEIESAQGNVPHMREGIRSSLRKFFKRVLERDPVVVVAISEI